MGGPLHGEELFDAHRAGDVVAFPLLQLGRNDADDFGLSRDEDVLKGVDPAAGLFDLVGDHLNGCFSLGDLDQAS